MKRIENAVGPTASDLQQAMRGREPNFVHGIRCFPVIPTSGAIQPLPTINWSKLTNGRLA